MFWFIIDHLHVELESDSQEKVVYISYLIVRDIWFIELNDICNMGFYERPLELFEKMKCEEFELEESEKLYYILMYSSMIKYVFKYE